MMNSSMMDSCASSSSFDTQHLDQHLMAVTTRGADMSLSSSACYYPRSSQQGPYPFENAGIMVGNGNTAVISVVPELGKVLDILHTAEEIVFDSEFNDQIQDCSFSPTTSTTRKRNVDEAAWMLEPTPLAPHAGVSRAPGSPLAVQELPSVTESVQDDLLNVLSPLLKNHNKTTSPPPAAKRQRFSSTGNNSAMAMPLQVESSSPCSVPLPMLMPLQVESSASSFLFGQQAPAAVSIDSDDSIAKGSTSSNISEGDTERFRPYQSGQWNERFQDLIDFKRKHGHCLVPHNFPENPQLAQWIKRQRYQYTLKQSKRHSTLSDERQTALEDLGFIWDSHKAAWFERFESLQQFKAQYGHCSVPSHFIDRSLAIWVKCQRRQYKLFQHGARSTMTQERFCHLDNLGFDWNPRRL